MEAEDSGQQPAHPNGQAGTFPKSTRGTDLFALKVLKAFAWVNLVTCIVTSVVVLHEYGVTFITEDEFFFNTTEKVLNPFAIAFSLFSFLFGIFGWAFCLVIAHMGENLIALRKSSRRLFSREEGGFLNL